MYVLDTKINETLQRPLRPYQYFDLIAGTSTDRIITIMLGTLRITIDDCIATYLKLAPENFPEKEFVSGE
jgi:hypothetical protein